MAGAIMVLGPSRWRESAGHSFLRGSPLEIRRDLASLMCKDGATAFVMEDHEPGESEDNFGFFQRLVDERQVTTFVLFWPLGARLHGLDVEIGYILTQLEAMALRPRDVYLLAEKRLIDLRSREAVLAWSEPGNRTRYHEDLVARGCKVRRWSTEHALKAHATAVVLEHQKTDG